MHYLSLLLSNIKLGLQHKAHYIRCHKTKLNDNMLMLLTDLGFVEGFGQCPRYRYKRLVTLNQVDSLLSVNSEGYLRFLGLTSLSYTQLMYSTFEIRFHKNSLFLLSFKMLNRFNNENNLKTLILSTPRGLITHKEALTYRAGGFLLCSFF